MGAYPGDVPFCSRFWLGADVFVPWAFFMVVGLEAFRAFWYRPHALQIVAPWGDLLQRGVLVVPQLLLRG